jgi:hypothetical protein
VPKLPVVPASSWKLNSKDLTALGFKTILISGRKDSRFHPTKRSNNPKAKVIFL